MAGARRTHNTGDTPAWNITETEFRSHARFVVEIDARDTVTVKLPAVAGAFILTNKSQRNVSIPTSGTNRASVRVAINKSVFPFHDGAENFDCILNSNGT